MNELYQNSSSSPLSNLSLYISIILKNLRFIVIVVFVSTVASIIYCYCVEPKYKSTAAVLPNQSKSFNKFGLSSLIPGLMGNSSDEAGVYSTYYYPFFIKSRTLSLELLENQYSFPIKNGHFDGNLYEYLETDDTTKAVETLQEWLDSETEYDTGIFGVSCTCPNAKLSAQIINNVLKALDEFNKQNRTNIAQNTFIHLDKRIEETYSDYIEASNDLTKYESLHRSGILSPKVNAELTDLQNRKELLQEIYLMLYKEREIAALDIKKETTVITVLDSAYVPTIKAFPKKKLIVVSVFVLSFLLSLVFIMLREYILNNLKTIPDSTKKSLNHSVNQFSPYIPNSWKSKSLKR